MATWEEAMDYREEARRERLAELADCPRGECFVCGGEAPEGDLCDHCAEAEATVFESEEEAA